MSKILTIGLLLAFMLVTARAYAQADGDREAALELFEQGVAEYRQGNFERSAELMREAYGLYEEPLLLYNLARALEQIGETEEAIDKYEAYLRGKPDAEDRGAVERRIDILRERLAEERREQAEQAGSSSSAVASPQQTAAASTAATSPSAEAGAPTRETASAPSPAPWIVAGAGVAIVAAGGVFGALAQRAHDDAVDDPVHRSAEASEGDADRWALLANVAFAVGGAAAAAGVVWGIVDLVGGGDEGERAVSLRVGPGRLTVAGRF